jgi:hypothetical protein
MTWEVKGAKDEKVNKKTCGQRADWEEKKCSYPLVLIALTRTTTMGKYNVRDIPQS